MEQSVESYHIVSTDNPNDTYPEGDKIISVEYSKGRGHNLYFNTMRYYVPAEFPVVIHLDDDDRFTTKTALERIRLHFQSHQNVVFWKVRGPGGIFIPDDWDKFPVFGNCTGIGFAVHVKNWINWQSVPGGDFMVIEHYFRTLKPVFIDEVLTEFQAGAGHGLKQDLII